MNDPYLYPNSSILRNLAELQNEEELDCMEAEYTCLRLAELVIKESASYFDFESLCKMHHYIFQDVYEWAGKIRIINIEKSEPALGGISIEYSDCFDIVRDTTSILKQMNEFKWNKENIIENFSSFMSKLWKIHPFREGNTRTIVTYCCQFIESKGFYIDSELFKDNAQYLRTSLVAASAIFYDIGDKRNSEYIERIVEDALNRGSVMKEEVVEQIVQSGHDVTEENIKKIVNWNRFEKRNHESEEIKEYLK